jgi:hypothetical protein
VQKSAQQRLDEIHRMAQLDELDPAGYAQLLGEELAGEPATAEELDSRDAALRRALAAVDAFAKKAMKIRMDHGLADDTLLPPTFRTYLASEVLGYENALDLLRDRVAATVGRVDPRRSHDLAEAVLEVATAVHRQRRALRDAVLELARELAAAAIPVARKAGWTPARRDLELLVERPARLAEAPMAQRIAQLPELEEVPEEPPSREELIELD